MIAYFDCFSGISGDMTLGAFFDLGISANWLKETLCSIPLEGFDISVSSVCRHGICAKKVLVQTEDIEKSRTYSEIKDLIGNSPLSCGVKGKSLEIFGKLAVAEAKIHDCPLGKVHFHELGGIDAIVDIVGSALCLEYLGITNIFASKIPLGTGFVSCRHGTLPVPVPATVAILKGVPTYGTEINCELVTPTGAAIVAVLAESFGAMPDMVIKSYGYGAGSRDIESKPNLLRVITGSLPDDQTDYQNEEIAVVETCIDDMNPEIFGFLMDRLFEERVLDVYWIPIFMKKNRPGTLIQVLCQTDQKDGVIERILSETTSLGVRYYHVKRRVLWRDKIEVKTSFGMIGAKRIKETNGNIRIVPEYENCKRIALEKNIPLRIIYDIIIKEIIAVSKPAIP